MSEIRHVLPRRVSMFVLVLVFFAATTLSADPKKDKGKAFGHNKDAVTVKGKGKERLTPPNRGGKPVDITIDYAKKVKDQLNVTDDDLAALTVRDQFTDKHNGVTHLYLRQQVGGIEVVDADLASHLTKDGEIISISSTLVRDLDEGANAATPTLSAVDAAIAAAAELELAITEPLEVVESNGGVTRETVLSAGGISSDPIQAKLVYQPVAADQARLAWSIDIEVVGGQHSWNITVDAATGEVLAGYDRVDHDNWDGLVPDTRRNAVLARAAANRAAAQRTFRPSAQATVNDGSGYFVFAQPLENPNDGSQTFVMNPAESVASPFGWHDTNGAAGAEFTRTRGNNVHAYTDVDANNVADVNSDPDGGPSLQFNFPWNPLLTPSLNRPPAVVNLFYWNNIVHDVYYQYGFDEMSGNFQVNNYGRGPTVAPLGNNDDVRAEAQDGSGTNNANFNTPVDGQRPRMQMFQWTYPFANEVVVNTPAAIAASYIATGASFPPAVPAGGITGDLAVALDAATPDGPTTGDGCTAITNPGDVAGKIAMVDRGTCTFQVKIKNAQDAGAIAVMVVNNSPNDPGTMGPASPPVAGITIPSVMIRLADGNLFKANLPVNATIRPNTTPPPNRDSDFDALVIAHEYGHGISNRLTGGRNVVNCLNNQEQMGEGWSDWLGLVLTTHPDDTPTTRRGVGTYLIWQNPLGNGIRPTPYSTDTAVNPTTYGSLPGLAVPHGVGYAWATMLWEMYWNLVAKHGYNANVYDPWTSGGNNLAIQLVMDGMKLQPCRPGFVNGRDAILQADVNLTGGANQCEIWRAFVKRGLGVNASQGSPFSSADGTQDFTKYDTGAPVISNISASPSVLQPPNHKMVDVAVAYDVTDLCSGVTTTLSVTSNEPEGASSDWEIVNNHLVRLRAERLGGGNDRIYTITITATDPDGNTSTATVTVTVPHDNGN
jgi:extracellular elastinolytic metalloproteinase